MLKKIIEDKRILALYIFVFIALFLGFTYALSDTSSLAINIETALISVDEDAYGDTNINTSDIDFRPIIDTEVSTNTDNVVKIEFSVGGANSNELTDVIYDIALVDLALDCELISPYIKWKLIKDGIELSSGTLEKGIKNRRLVLTEDQEDLPVYSSIKEGYHNYIFYMWFSDSCQNEDLTTCFGKIDQSELVGKKFKGKIEVELYTEFKAGYGPIENRESSDNSACIGNNSYLDFDENDFTVINTTPNAPNLDNGSLIPVYYDEFDSYTYTITDETSGTEVEKEVVGVWKKADSNNIKHSWYNYSEKKWANAVLISNSSSTDYSMSEVNTIIKESDIDAFYVWIPRFKYKVWNITRQGGHESTYAYDAFSKGIQISFEEGTSSTGNIRCEYNVRNSTPETILSDECYYNGLGVPVKPTDNNKDYSAWYTHPAFNFGGVEKEGFWMGKFETSGSSDAPQILPDKVALTNQNVSTQFTTSKVLQGRFSNLDAHMLTNLEWGAVAYLSYSFYGTCDYFDKNEKENTYCTPVNQNNSNSLYTGRSGGAPANSDLLTLNNVYGTGGTNRSNNFGYYNYKGYKLDSATGEPTILKYIDKVASTTKNITGVYDMSGGAFEIVMGYIGDLSIISDYYAGKSWDGSTNLSLKYFNEYSKGSTYNDQVAYNRSRLGDATAEVLGGVGDTKAWNLVISVSYSRFPSNNYFFRRDDISNLNTSGIFSFNWKNGAADTTATFRSSLS